MNMAQVIGNLSPKGHLEIIMAAVDESEVRMHALREIKSDPRYEEGDDIQVEPVDTELGKYKITWVRS